MTTRLMLDFDEGAQLDRDALYFLLRCLHADDAAQIVRWSSYPTARGRHEELTLSRDYPPLAIVAMQVLLGSDKRRETFNLIRALVLGSAPDVSGFWREDGRWNTLYAEKLGRLGLMIDPNKFGTGRPALTPADLDGADAAVLTVLNAEEIEINQDGEARPRLILTFEEFPDKAYWCNVTAVRTLVGKLGPNEVKWIGRQVPLVVANTRNPSTKKMQDVLWVEDGEKWDDLIAEATRPAKRSTQAKGTTSATKARGKR